MQSQAQYNCQLKDSLLQLLTDLDGYLRQSDGRKGCHSPYIGQPGCATALPDLAAVIGQALHCSLASCPLLACKAVAACSTGRLVSMPAFTRAGHYSTAQHIVWRRQACLSSYSSFMANAEPSCTTRLGTAQHTTAQRSTAPDSLAQHGSKAKQSTAQLSKAQHSTAPHSTAPHSTAQLMQVAQARE